jgi:hypothetical protein
MGDRAMAEIKTAEGSLYFYTHWCGSELPYHATEAVKTASARKGDSSYALRIVIDQLIKRCGARDQETGAGIMFSPNCEDSYNGNNPSVVIDLSSMSIKVFGSH